MAEIAPGRLYLPDRTARKAYAEQVAQARFDAMVIHAANLPNNAHRLALYTRMTEKGHSPEWINRLRLAVLDAGQMAAAA